jgi:hypothetical protein
VITYSATRDGDYDPHYDQRMRIASCRGAHVTAFPSFDQSCTSADACVLVFHLGGREGLGAGARDRQRHADAAAVDVATCQAQLGPCGCPHVLDAGFVQWQLGCPDGSPAVAKQIRSALTR